MSEKAIDINSLSELMDFKNELIKNPSDDIRISNISGVTYTIKLSGGRFENYGINYINADIAKIILDYQTKYDEFIDVMERISLSKELQTPVNSFKRALASTLKDNELAVLNLSVNDSFITNKDAKSFKNKSLLLDDVEEIVDIEDTI
ncbi:hypothetical protein [Campylobacter geochelonis]|uniref:hypothetical protein n=1 Tax=Campylobacter geochelonis TaxID=1780362 RepID=UPI0007708B57|nr:hypothetical protein [Campylobacter geochelonis]CZE47907.1 Uncharacterised protein [Campylobacter geochelonis]CZE50813.1 Uncharacterised protein [Campylobacter geochelonis]